MKYRAFSLYVRSASGGVPANQRRRRRPKEKLRPNPQKPLNEARSWQEPSFPRSIYKVSRRLSPRRKTFSTGAFPKRRPCPREPFQERPAPSRWYSGMRYGLCLSAGSERVRGSKSAYIRSLNCLPQEKEISSFLLPSRLTGSGFGGTFSGASQPLLPQNFPWNTVGAVVPTAPAFRLADCHRRSGFSPCPEVFAGAKVRIFAEIPQNPAQRDFARLM